MINGGDTVTLCIGGRVFVTRRATLYRLPESRLFMIANKIDSDKRPLHNYSNNTLNTNTTSSIGTGTTGSDKKDAPVYFFDRDPEIFRFVLDYYRTGELHLPSSICGPFVRKELIFWGIDESLIGACCMPAYMRYDEEKRTKKTLFRDFFEDIDSMKNLVKYCRGFKRWRYQMWLFLDHPSSSVLAKAWASILLGLMITSFMCFCLSTHEAFRRKTRHLVNYNTSSICTHSNIISNRKINKDCTTETHNALLQLDVILNIIFTLEFIMKLLLAPYKYKFLRSSICILDICILSAYWLYMSSYYFYYYYQNNTKNATALWALNVLSMTQCLRILRIFKISKISRGLRVLMLTIKKSIPELVLLAFLLMNGMFLFSSLIYMAEYKEPKTFPDIPKAFWWSIVTLTTVGYGDSFPKGGPGYLIGSMTAICGCILTGLAIPIIGNNFNTYYMYMKNQLKEDKYLRELRKDMNHVSSNVTKGNAHKVKYAHFGKTNNCGNVMFRRKFTTVDCPQLQGLNLNCSPQPIKEQSLPEKQPSPVPDGDVKVSNNDSSIIDNNNSSSNNNINNNDDAITKLSNSTDTTTATTTKNVASIVISSENEPNNNNNNDINNSQPLLISSNNENISSNNIDVNNLSDFTVLERRKSAIPSFDSDYGGKDISANGSMGAINAAFVENIACSDEMPMILSVKSTNSPKNYHHNHHLDHRRSLSNSYSHNHSCNLNINNNNDFSGQRHNSEHNQHYLRHNNLTAAYSDDDINSNNNNSSNYSTVNRREDYV